MNHDTSSGIVEGSSQITDDGQTNHNMHTK